MKNLFSRQSAIAFAVVFLFFGGLAIFGVSVPFVPSGWALPTAHAVADDALMVYDTYMTTSTPKYRLWDGTSWGGEQFANDVNGEIRHMVLKYAPTRNEAILATLGSTGEVQAQVWNGTSSAWGAVTTLGTVADLNGNRDNQSQYRGFDLEYETISGDAIVVFGDGTADPDYRVWNGTTWSAPADINVPTTGMPAWIELASSFGSDGLTMILVDGNTDIYAMRWTGSAWDNMGDAAAWDVTASTVSYKSVDVAFERTSGDIMFMWGDSTSTDQYYRTWSGTTLSSSTLLDNPNAAGVDRWVRLVSDPATSSNKIMFGVLDAGSDLNTFEWDGSAWSAVHAEHDDATENVLDFNFDITYETHASNSGVAWVVWGDGATVASRRYSAGSWAASSTRGDDTAVIALEAHPATGAVFSLAYESDADGSTNDIKEMRLTNGTSTWTSQAGVWDGPTGRINGFMRIAAAGQRSGGSGAMMAYDTYSITSIPKYRLWDGSAWGAEQSASPVMGEIRHIALKYAPTRNEAILATLGSLGNVDAQVWNGTSWGAATTLGGKLDGGGDTYSPYRFFDIEYESISGDALAVFGSSRYGDPTYRVWNGTSWSASTTLTTPTNSPYWVELSSAPASDEIALIILDYATDVYGLRWTGSSWDNMGDAVVWDPTASSVYASGIDVAYERTSGDIMFIWGDSTSTDQYYRTYSSGALSGSALLDNPNAASYAYWIELAADPATSSNKIMFGMQDYSSDLNTFEWDGSAWSTVHPEHDDAVEATTKTFSIAYETHVSNPGVAWLVWGDGSTVASRRYSAGSWAASSTRGDDTQNVALEAHPSTGAVFALMYEDGTSATDDLREMNLTNGTSTWTSQSIMWGGPVGRTAGFSRMAVAGQRYESVGGLPTQPGTPTYSNVGTSTLTVSWTAATSSDYYKIERATSSESYVQFATTTATSTADSGRTPNTTYFYRLRGTNAQGDGPYSATSSQLMLSGAPGTPTYTSVSTSTLTVNWTAPTGGASYYRVERGANGSGPFTEQATTTALLYNDSGLTASTTYWYRSRGTNATGNGQYGATSSVTTQSAASSSPPNAPSQDSPSNGVQNVSVTPVFKMTATDPESDKLQYKVTLYSNSGCTTVVATYDQSVSQTGWSGQNTTCFSGSDCYTSGSQGAYTVQSALSTSATYWWRASAKDPLGSNTWINSASCNSFTTTSGLWTTDSGNWSISGSALLVTPPSASTTQIHVTGQSQTNGVIEVKLKASAGNIGDASPIMRADSGSNRYQPADVYYPATQRHRIGKTVSGSYTTITSTTYTFSADVFYELRGYISGSSLWSWVNGGSALSATDSSLSGAGFVGVVAYNSNTFTFDNFAFYTSSTITLNNLPGGGSWGIQSSTGTVLSCLTGSTWDLSTYGGQVPIDYDNGGGKVAAWTNSSCFGGPAGTYPPAGLAVDIFGGDTYSYSGGGQATTVVRASSTITVSQNGLISF